MLQALESARQVRDRLRNPPNGRHSTELEIATAPELRRRRIQQIREADTARRDMQLQEAIASVVAKAKEPKVRPQKLSTDFEPPIIPKTPTVNAIISTVSDYYQTSLVEIISQRRTADAVRVRHIVCYLARVLTTLSLPQIGRYIGRRDHTTVLHGYRKIEQLLAEQPGLQAEIDDLKRRLA